MLVCFFIWLFDDDESSGVQCHGIFARAQLPNVRVLSCLLNPDASFVVLFILVIVVTIIFVDF